MAAPKNILLVRLKSIGDVVLTLPAVCVVRENFPAAKITFLTTQENGVLLRGFRDVDEVILLDRASLRSGHPLKIVSSFFQMLRKLRAGKFDLVVDLQGYGETAWLARVTGAPQRWGVVYSTGRDWAYTRSVPRPKTVHPAENYLTLLQAGGLKCNGAKNEFFLPADALTEAQKFLYGQNLDAAKPLLFLQPFTSSPNKNWPLENFLALAQHWQARGWQIIFGGGPSDRAALEPLRANGFVISAGVPLLVTGGLMQLSRLIVGGDTGAMHLAVAQGKRVVMLMNNARPGRPHPFRQAEWTLAPAVEGDIAGIKIHTVVAACEDILAN